MFQTKLLLRTQAFLRTTNTRFSEHTGWARRRGFGRSIPQADSLPMLQKARTIASLPKHLTGRTAASPTNSQETKSKIPTDRDWCDPTVDGKPAFGSIPSSSRTPLDIHRSLWASEVSPFSQSWLRAS